VLALPIKHGEGCWVADEATLARPRARGRGSSSATSTRAGGVTPEANPNGSLGNVAGVVQREAERVGLMPHPSTRSSADRLGARTG
jgi:phosphoribosylformylglycinamidine synthase